MRRSALITVSIVLAACGGARPVAAPTARTSPDDPAVTLAALLPGGVHECVVARPSRLDENGRRGARWVSRAYPFAWLPGLDVRAYAGASQVTEPYGERNDVVLLDVVGDPAQIRATLSAQPWLALRWDGFESPCTDLDCARVVARASMVPGRAAHEQQVQIRRGTWRAVRRTPIDGHCAGLLRDHAELVEASATFRPVEGFGETHWEHRTVQVGRTGLAVTSRITLPDALAGNVLLQSLRSGYDGPARVVSQAVEGDTLVRVAEASWDDLALAAGDEERLASAMAHEAVLRSPRPVAEVDVTDYALVRAQVASRRAALSTLAGTARADAASDLLALLEAAHAALPDDVAIGTGLVRLQLDELHDGAAAARVAAEMRPRAPDEDAFSTLEREALAVGGDEAALAAALVRDGVLGAAMPERVARRVAADVIAATHDGVRYAWAEGGARAGAMLSATPSPPLVAVERPASLPLVGTPAALIALLRLGAADRWAPRAVYVRASGQVQAPPHVSGEDGSPAEPLFLHDGAEQPMLLLAGRSDDGAGALARLGRDLVSASGEGNVTIAISFVPFDRAEPARPEVTLVVAGRVHAGVLELAHVSRNGSGLDWDLVARMLAAPLAAIPSRLYPPAEVAIDARDVAEAARLAERAAPDVSCARDEAHLSCRAIAGSSDDLERTLVEMAGELLGDSPRALYARLPAGPHAVQRPR